MSAWWASLFNEYVNPASVIVSLIVSVPIFWTWYEVTMGRKRRHKRWFREAQERKGSQPVLLIVDLISHRPIRTQVEHFRKTVDGLSEIPDGHVFVIDSGTIGAPGRDIRSDDMTTFADKLQQKIGEIYRIGPDVIHYFHQGPVASAAVAGAQLANICEVKIYHWNQKTYESWGLLRHRFVS